MNEIDSDALNVMKQAGQEFAEKQMFRHWHNEWKLSIEQQNEQINQWITIKNRIGELADEMKKLVKKG